MATLGEAGILATLWCYKEDSPQGILNLKNR